MRKNVQEEKALGHLKSQVAYLGWAKTMLPLEHLLPRTGKIKSFVEEGALLDTSVFLIPLELPEKKGDSTCIYGVWDQPRRFSCRPNGIVPRYAPAHLVYVLVTSENLQEEKGDGTSIVFHPQYSTLS